MKVLVLSQLYNSRSFLGISMVNLFLDLIGLVNGIRDDIEWHIAVPSSKRFHHWDDAYFQDLGIRQLPILAEAGCRIGVPRQDGFLGEHHALYGPQAYRFFSSREFLDFDVVLDNFYHCSILSQMQASHVQFDHPNLPKCVLPTVVGLFTEAPSDPGLLKKLETPYGERLAAVSAACADKLIVLAKEDAECWRRIFSGHLSASVMRRLQFQSVLPVVDIRKVPVPDERPRGRTVFFHGGSLEGRNLHLVIDAVSKVYAGYSAAKLILTAQDARTSETEKKWSAPFVDLRLGCGRQEFLQALPDGDFSLCHVDYAATGLAYIETVASGMTPIFVKRPWLMGRLPDGYRFLVDKADFPAALLYAAKNPGATKDIGQEAVDFCRRTFGADALGKWCSDFFDDCLATRMAKRKQHFSDDIVSTAYASLPDEFSVDDALSVLAMSSKKLKRAYFKTAWPSIALTFQKLGAMRGKDGVFTKGSLDAG